MLLLGLTTLLLGRYLLLLVLLHVGISSKAATVGTVVSTLRFILPLLLLVTAVLVKATLSDACLVRTTASHAIVIHVARTVTSPLVKMINTVSHIVGLGAISCKLLRIVLILVLVSCTSMGCVVAVVVATVVVIVMSVSAVSTSTAMVVLLITSLMGTTCVV